MSFPLIAVPPRPTPFYAYGESQIDAANSTSYTFLSMVSNATGGPYLAVVGGYSTSQSSATLTSATIGGVAATIVAQGTFNSSTDPLAFLIQAVVTDTTPDVVLTFSGLMGRCGVRIWALENLASTTAIDTGNDDTSATLSLDLNMVKDGIVIAVAGQVLVSNLTWVGAVEDEAKEAIEGTASFSSASAQVVTPSTPLTLEAQFASAAFNAGVSASWR